MPMIEVEDLRKNYGSFRALLGVSFKVERGEILGFLGPNGAGKTTTMKILTGFLYPSFGSAKVAGSDVVADSLEVRRRIGYLPEHTPLYDDMSVREYLRFCGALRGMPSGRLRERMDAVVSMTGLGSKYRALIKTLSKGYRQRVGLAQAIIHEPEIIILDEPTVGLDPNQVVDVRGLIRNLGKDRTVILCSHILSEVEAVCGRVLIIHEGQIVADGTPDALGSQLQHKEFYRVSARGAAQQLMEAVSGVAGAASVSIAGDADGTAVVRFEAEASDREVSAAVAAAVRGAGLSLQSLIPQRATLEEVFRAKTGEEN